MLLVEKKKEPRSKEPLRNPHTQKNSGGPRMFYNQAMCPLLEQFLDNSGAQMLFWSTLSRRGNFALDFRCVIRKAVVL